MKKKEPQIINIGLSNYELLPDGYYKPIIKKIGKKFTFMVEYKKQLYDIWSIEYCPFGEGIMNWNEYKERTKNM